MESSEKGLIGTGKKFYILWEIKEKTAKVFISNNFLLLYCTRYFTRTFFCSCLQEPSQHQVNTYFHLDHALRDVFEEL
jgi:hypothetical protein